MALAETYVLEQGFTDKVFLIDTLKIKPDFVEQIMSREDVAKMRFNLFEPKTVFQYKKYRNWLIGFQYVSDSTRFRLVKIRRGGKIIEMKHQDLASLSAVENNN